MIFGYFGGSLDTRRFWKYRFFWFLVDFDFFDFLGFLGGRKIVIASRIPPRPLGGFEASRLSWGGTYVEISGPDRVLNRVFLGLRVHLTHG